MSTRDTVKIVGWLWFGMGATGIPTGVIYLFVPRLGPEPPIAAPICHFVWRHPELVGIWNLALGAGLMVISALFLRKHNWARRALQLISVAMGVFCLVAVVDFLRILVFLEVTNPSVVYSVVRAVFLVVGLLFGVAMLTPFALCARWLGRPAVAAEFQNRV